MQGSRGQRGRTSAQGRAWRTLLEVHAEAVQALNEEMKRDADMDLQFYDVLLHVSEAKDGLRMKELAQAVVLSKSGFTSLVDRMEVVGLIERQPDPEDRRATRIALTRKGARRFAEAMEVHREVVHRIFTSVVTEAEAVVIVTALERVRQGLRVAG